MNLGGRLACLWLTLSGCGVAAAPVPSPKSATAAAPIPPPAAGIAPQTGRFLAFPAALHAFEEERLTGAMALFDSRDGKLWCSDAERCDKGYLPASTFKIANAIIGLETGIVSDAESPLPWDGKEYSNPAWNRDHTLRSAIQVSCVPCFQAIARKVGEASMSEWLKRLDYGNRDSSGPVDTFWLTGALRISPLEQVDFLRRLDEGKLNVTERTLDTVRDVITLDVGPEHVLRGKTGLVGPPEQPSEIGWFVGYVELGQQRVFFATVIDGHAEGVDLKPARRRVTERVLRELGDLPG